MLIAAVVITISSFDDLFIDMACWFSCLLGTAAESKSSCQLVDVLAQYPAGATVCGHGAVLEEHDVIFSMLSSNSRLVLYEQGALFRRRLPERSADPGRGAQGAGALPEHPSWCWSRARAG